MAAPVARTRSRPLVATAVAALLLFVLSGCVKFNADFHVDAEETLTGTMQILVDPIALEDMGSNPSSELDDAVSDAQADPELPDGVTVDRVEDEDGYIGMGVTFDRVPAAELQNGGSGLDDVGVEGIEVVHTDGEISFTMANPLTAGMDSSDPFGSSGMPSSARSILDEALVSITFPGNVIAADGAETDGKTATWNLREYDGDTLTATGDASSFPWGVVLIAGGVLLFLLIAAGVVVLILVLRRRKGASGGSPGPYAADGGRMSGHPGVPGAAAAQHPHGVPPPGGPLQGGPPEAYGVRPDGAGVQPGGGRASGGFGPRPYGQPTGGPQAGPYPPPGGPQQAAPGQAPGSYPQPGGPQSSGPSGPPGSAWPQAGPPPQSAAQGNRRFAPPRSGESAPPPVHGGPPPPRQEDSR